MPPRLHAKTALVTGAASGIGERVAALFAIEGATVILRDRDSAAAEKAAAPFPEGVQVEMDIADESSVAAAFAGLAKRGLHPDVVVRLGVPWDDDG
jgi:NAD(P)-dependent dehydrogenase (short-subunit alcohol dehydrogenase family)